MGDPKDDAKPPEKPTEKTGGPDTHQNQAHDAGFGPSILTPERSDIHFRLTSVTAAERTRLALRARFTNPQVARRHVDLNEGWMPVSTDVRLVKR